MHYGSALPYCSVWLVSGCVARFLELVVGVATHAVVSHPWAGFNLFCSGVWGTLPLALLYIIIYNYNYHALVYIGFKIYFWYNYTLKFPFSQHEW